jgi:hypothetical protein
VQLGTLEDVQPGFAQIGHADVRVTHVQRGVAVHLDPQEVASQHGQLIEPGRGQLHALVLDEAAHQLGTRVFGLVGALHLLGWQQHARLDLDEHRRHQQVLGGQLEVVLADLIDVGQVLARDVGQRDVEDVEVLLADQVEQQVERALEGVEEDLEGIGRDVQVGGHGEQRLAIQPRHDFQFELFADRAGRGVGVVDRRAGQPGLGHARRGMRHVSQPFV